MCGLRRKHSIVASSGLPQGFIVPLKHCIVQSSSSMAMILNHKKNNLDTASSITHFHIKPNTTSKFQLKDQAQISTIAKMANISDSDLELTDDSDGESTGKDVGEAMNQNRFEFLLRLFVNLGYYICLVPFRLVPVAVGHKPYFEIRHNFLQRVISMLQCCSASVVCFLVAYAQIGGQNIENNPLVIFNFWSYSVFCGWCFLFMNIFWRKEHLILAIVNREQYSVNTFQNQTHETSNWDERIATLYFFGAVVEEIYHKSVFYLFPKTYGLRRAAEVYSGKALYSLFMRNSSDAIQWEEISTTAFGVSVWHFVGWQIFGAIKSLIYIFVTFGSLFLVGRINREFECLRKVARGKEYHGENYVSKQIWSHFVDIRSVVDQVNELTNLCVLGIYLILVPFLSSSFIQRWDSDFIEYKVLMVLQFVWPMIALITASEASRLGENFLRAVKDGSDNVNDRGGTHCSAYFVYENANLSMRGGKYFKVSYGFMGATLTVVMTYGLVILGFLHESLSKTRKC